MQGRRVMPTAALSVREDRAPLWARVAPGLYLAAAAFAVRAVVLDSSIDVGIYGLVIAIGLVPAFVIPVVFSERRATLQASEDGLLVDGSLSKINEVRLARGERGTGTLHVELRDGTMRSFVAATYKDAQRLMADIPPVSAPAGALAARA